MLTVPERSLAKYLARHRQSRPLEPAAPLLKFDRAVVIPALAESHGLPRMLAALAANPAAELERTLVLIVVNHHPECDAEKKNDNAHCLDMLRGGLWQPRPPHVYWIDAASPGNEITRTGGVGEARKIGLDSALPYLNWHADPLLYCLDGDTLVEPDYLATAANAFRAAPDAAAGVIRFIHQPGATPAEEAAIRDYEKYLDAYVLGLRRAGSPYDYHAMGSATVARAAAYVLSGGMKVRSAGEDFYYLQGLRKVGPILELHDTVVHPSTRPSDRVPFGTGRKIRQVIGGEPIQFYPASVFDRLAEVLNIANRAEPEELLRLPELLEQRLPPESWAYFRDNAFAAAWPKIITNTPAQTAKRRWAFHTWFDAFRTLKFIHMLAPPDLQSRSGRTILSD